ncbi:MAG: glycine cleavage system H protein [Candidatus Promineifilaceae bacterium]|jgi:glycine cleavage system H protein
MNPSDRKYTKSHEWIKVEDDEAIVGITDYAQEAMGDVTFVELPSVGTSFTKASDCGVIESVKAASDLYCPVDGTIADVNVSLEDAPELINQDPYEDGWLLKLRDFDAAQVDALMTADEYTASLVQDS